MAAGAATAAQMSALVDVPACGRVYRSDRRAGFGDCAPSGRMRLDGLARWLQDVAFDDIADAGLAFSAVWVVRRTRISVRRFPRFAERCTLATFCSGIGRMWAERRTQIRRPDAAAADVEAVSLWVHLDVERWRPCPLSEPELAAYSEPYGERRVSARLRHPPPDGASQIARFAFRACDCDLAGHVNNAAYWAALEEELLVDRRAAEPAALEVEMEHRSPAQPGEHLLLGAGPWRWIASADGEVHASALTAHPAKPQPKEGTGVR
jgi:acyl-ACP thioesterase